MTPFVVTVDPALVAAVSPTRAEEWRALGADLAEAVHSLDGREGAWTVGTSSSSTGLDFVVGDDRGRSASIARTDLDTLFDEYLEVIGRLGPDADADEFSRVDALDMAKKVTHDRAGRVLKRAMRELEADHEVARRAFSLFLALVIDTTGFAGAHAALVPRQIV